MVQTAANQNIQPNGQYEMVATLAIASVPCQKWSAPYEPAEALKAGTIFPELNKPFFMGGDINGR